MQAERVLDRQWELLYTCNSEVSICWRCLAALRHIGQILIILENN